MCGPWRKLSEKVKNGIKMLVGHAVLGVLFETKYSTFWINYSRTNCTWPSILIPFLSFLFFFFRQFTSRCCVDNFEIAHKTCWILVWCVLVPWTSKYLKTYKIAHISNKCCFRLFSFKFKYISIDLLHSIYHCIEIYTVLLFYAKDASIGSTSFLFQHLWSSCNKITSESKRIHYTNWMIFLIKLLEELLKFRTNVNWV